MSQKMATSQYSIISDISLFFYLWLNLESDFASEHILEEPFQKAWCIWLCDAGKCRCCHRHHPLQARTHTHTHTHAVPGRWQCKCSSFTALTVHLRAIRNTLHPASCLKRPVICHFSSYGTVSENGGCGASGTLFFVLFDTQQTGLYYDCGGLHVLQLLKPS